jgi:hypothetical protein
MSTGRRERKGEGREKKKRVPRVPSRAYPNDLISTRPHLLKVPYLQIALQAEDQAFHTWPLGSI